MTSVTSEKVYEQTRYTAQPFGDAVLSRGDKPPGYNVMRNPVIGSPSIVGDRRVFE